MAYPTRPTFPTHGDCANFRNGLCILKGTAIDPKGIVCPNFTPKSTITIPNEVKAHPKALRPRQFYQPETTQGDQTYHPLQNGYHLLPPSCYQTWYNSGSVALGPTTPIRGAAGFLFISGGSRGGGRGRGRMGGGFAAGPGGSCVCPRCGYTTPHTIGTPCYQQTCPKCGSRMTRGA